MLIPDAIRDCVAFIGHMCKGNMSVIGTAFFLDIHLEPPPILDYGALAELELLKVKNYGAQYSSTLKLDNLLWMGFRMELLILGASFISRLYKICTLQQMRTPDRIQ